MADSVKRSSKEVVSPAFDTAAAESRGHHDGGAPSPSRSSKTLAGPYETSKEEAKGHGDAR